MNKMLKISITIVPTYVFYYYQEYIIILCTLVIINYDISHVVSFDNDTQQQKQLIHIY